MKIDRSNYETFFLDFHEGNLSEGLTRELFSFLDSNPDLKEEFESFEMIAVSPSDEKFFDKNNLKKDTITSSNYKIWFVGYIENDLTSEQKKEVEQFVERNPSLKPELEIFKQTKLVPDHQIIFEDKKQLKRGGKVILFTPQFNRIAVAASIALLLLTYFFFRNTIMKNVAHREVPKSEIRREKSPVLSDQKSFTDRATEEETKKEEKQLNRLAERKNTIEKINHAVKQETPVKEIKTNEPLFTQLDATVQSNAMEKEDSSGNLLAVNKIHEPFKPTSSELSQVFSDDELKELGVKKDIQQNKKASLWDLASKGANELSKVTGTDISLKKKSDEIEDTKTYALAIGGFSVSHTSGK